MAKFKKIYEICDTLNVEALVYAGREHLINRGIMGVKCNHVKTVRGE